MRTDGLAVLEVGAPAEVAERSARGLPRTAGLVRVKLRPAAGLHRWAASGTALEVAHDPVKLLSQVAVPVRLAGTEVGADSLPVREEPSTEVAESLGLRRRHWLTLCHGLAPRTVTPDQG
jgi:hypothetical protein